MKGRVTMPRALIWDIDGTVAETEAEGHRVAFNIAFKEFGLPWRWDLAHYGRLLRVTGGYERLLHDLAQRREAPGSETERRRLARELHRRKNALYAERVALRGIPFRPGVRQLMDRCLDEGLPQAIATTTARANVDALLGAEFGPHWAERFEAVVCAEEAPRKKPDPQVYQLALQRLRVALHEALAIEDSPNGLAAATGAGVPVLITRSTYFADADVEGALAVCDDLEQAGIDGPEALRALCRRLPSESARGLLPA